MMDIITGVRGLGGDVDLDFLMFDHGMGKFVGLSPKSVWRFTEVANNREIDGIPMVFSHVALKGGCVMKWYPTDVAGVRFLARDQLGRGVAYLNFAWHIDNF